jgi:predicted DNA binding protein
MTLYETAFRLQHDCPLNDFSREHPELVMSTWCNSSTDVFEVTRETDATYEEIQRDMDKMWKAMKTKPLRKSITGNGAQVVIQHCGCQSIAAPVSPVFEKHNCLELQPCIYKGGWEYYRFISFDEKDTRKVLSELERYCKIEMISRRAMAKGSVKDTMLVSTSQLFGGLTRKQVQALIFAVENGYYQVPKKVTTEQMASKLKQPRTTYEEHLRKAEAKVIRSMAPYITMGPSE